MRQKELSDYQTSGVECPTCGRTDFKSKEGMRRHHSIAHGESVAKTEVECEYCGDSYTISKSEIERTRFCSRECKNSAMETDLHPNRTTKTVNCSNCGSDVVTTRQERREFDNHYCDSDCMYSHQQGKNHHNYNSVTEPCQYCGRDCERSVSSIGEIGPFCNHECYGNYLSEERNGQDAPAWRGGVSHTDAIRKNLGQRAWRKMAEDVRKDANRRCESCGKSPDGKKLDVHHIVPLVCGGDNGEYNLMALCDDCHTSADWFVRKYPEFDAVLIE